MPNFKGESWYFKHGSNATLVKDKCWMHIGTKLTLGHSWIYVREHYELLLLYIT